MPSWRDARQIGLVFPGTTEENRSRAEVVGTGTDCSDRSDRTRPPGVARLASSHARLRGAHGRRRAY